MMIEETGWLIELRSNGSQPPMWWGRVDDGEAICDWTKDNLKAVRFCREQDAQAIIDENGWTEVIPTDHMWCDYSHKWGFLMPLHSTLESCSECGVVRRADDKNGPCNGPMKLRPMESPIGGSRG